MAHTNTNTNTNTVTKTIPQLFSGCAQQREAELPDETRMARAYERFAAARAAIPEAELVRPNADVMRAVQTVVDAWPGLRGLRERWVAELPASDVRCLDELCERAFAMVHAYMSTAQATKRASDELGAMYEEAKVFRTKLTELGRALASFRIVPQDAFAGLGAAVGYRNLSIELASLAKVYRKHWSSIEGQAPVSLAQLNECERLANLLMVASFERGSDSGENLRASAMLERQRAFTHFVQAFDEVRSALVYLRRHERDADALLPSIYGGRGPARDERDADPDDDDSASALAAPRSAVEAADEGALDTLLVPVPSPATAPSRVLGGDRV